MCWHRAPHICRLRWKPSTKTEHNVCVGYGNLCVFPCGSNLMLNTILEASYIMFNTSITSSNFAWPVPSVLYLDSSSVILSLLRFCCTTSNSNLDFCKRHRARFFVPSHNVCYHMWVPWSALTKIRTPFRYGRSNSRSILRLGTLRLFLQASYRSLFPPCKLTNF